MGSLRPSSPAQRRSSQNPYSEILWIQESSSTLTLSSNATADNLPGPGRTLGLFYSSAGRIIERLVNTPVINGVVPVQGTHESDSSSISTNATAPNLPGAGRTVGLFFSFAGKILESNLNRLAVRWGAGPRPIARKVHNYFDHIDRDSWTASDLSLSRSKGNKNVKKDVSKLLKYVRSNFEVNQLSALDQIITLAVYHPHARELFNVLGALTIVHESYSRAASASLNDSDVLLCRSRRALVALTEVHVNSIGHTLSIHRIQTVPVEARGTIMSNNLQELLDNMHHPDLTFLVLRHLKAVIKDSLSTGQGGFYLSSDILSTLTKTLSTIPEYVEFKTAEYLIRSLLQIHGMYAIYLTPSGRRKWAPLFAVIFRFAHKFGAFLEMLESQYICASMMERLHSGSHFEFSPQHVELVTLILQGITGNRSWRTNALELDVTAIRNKYSHPSLSRMWDTLLSKPYIILLQIVHERNQVLERDRANAMLVSRVAKAERLSMLCLDMVRILEDSLASSQLNDSIRLIEVIKLQDRYCSRAIATALTATLTQNKLSTTAKSKLQQLCQQRCTRDKALPVDVYQTSEYISIFRHVKNGHLLHLFNEPFMWKFPDPCLSCISLSKAPSKDAEELTVLFESVLWLEIASSSPFSASEQDHYPVVAGINEDGETEYVARIFDPHSPGVWGWLGTVVDGSTFARYWTNRGEIRTSFYFDVLVLRFDPETEEMEEGCNLNLTGHLKWT